MSIGRAVVGVVAGAGLVGAGYAGIGGTDDTTRTEDGQIVEGGELGAFRIRLGDCFNDATVGDEIESVDGVPCSGPHDQEVYFAFNLPDGPWPGRTAVEEAVGEGCYNEFSNFTGSEYETSAYDFSAVFPTVGSWEEFDDREVLCTLTNYDGTQKVGSGKGTGL